ncbi:MULTISPECIES: ABC transporter permease [unclassified Clostridioides]|uniref:ABC transporter permease n=1 Tax=unclassified Clostridioides TaxID=2635829 RepID=UPI001D113E60|nr:ABC transporter permease [Clostridioides sp. ES-S-0056-01]MCC0715388.1 ABC transporter permease [Clostridioides sp. ES-S-0077-01]
MNLYTSLTIRYLKQNKRGTIVTIIGIILSTALICGIGNIFESFMDYQVRETIKNDGSFHVTFHDVNKKDIEYVTKSAEIEKHAFSKQIGYSKLENSENGILSIKQYDKNAMEGYQISVKEGRLPSKVGEIVLSENVINLMDDKLKIGDEIILKVGDMFDSNKKKVDNMVFHEGDYIANEKDRTFKLVGIIKKPGFELYDEITTAITYFNLLDYKGTMNISVTVKNPKDVYKISKKISKNIYPNKDEESISDMVKYNEHLLRLQGASKYANINSSIKSIISVVTILVIICTIATVYNSFSISITERKKQFGILNSIGATSSQIKKLVLIEGIIISLIGIPIGLISGTIAIDLLFKIINKYFTKSIVTQMSLQIVYNPIIIIASIIIVLFTIFISILLPAIAASNISPLDIIKNSGEYKVRKVKDSKLIKMIFKTEGVLAYKNMRRNRKKFIVTLFSLMISIIIFVSFSGFTLLLLKGEEIRNSQKNYDLYLTAKGTARPVDDVISTLQDIPGIKNFELATGQYISIKVSENKINKSNEDLIKEYYEQHKNGDSYEYDFINNELEFPGEFAIKNKTNNLIKGSFDKEKAIKENGVILVRKSYFESRGKKGIVELTNYKVGDTVNCEYLDDNGSSKKMKIKILAITDEERLGMGYQNMGLQFITYDEVAKNLGLKLNRSLIFIDSGGDVQTKKKVESLADKNNFNFHDESAGGEEEKQNLKVIKIFVYGFIAVISLVSVTNILNTVSTSINLRKRELAIIQSIGVTPKGFRKMIYLESFIYGILSLLFGIPISIGITLIMNKLISGVIEFSPVIPWTAIAICIISIFIITFIAAYIPMSKLNKENIIDNIRRESI